MKLFYIFALLLSLFIAPLVGFCTTFEVLTVGTSTAVPFTSARLTERPVVSVLVVVESADIRILYGTSTSPTSSSGIKIANGSSFRISNDKHIQTFKAIGISGTASVSCLYEP